MERGILNPIGAYELRGRDTVEESLERLLAENALIARENGLYSSKIEKRESETMSRPMTFERAYSIFGSMLGGLLPPALLALFLFSKAQRMPPIILVILTLIAAGVSAITGYFTGNAVGGFVQKMPSRTFTQKFFIFILVGSIWGAISGAAGGIFLFGIGAIFGSIIGALAGSVAMPAFSFPFLWLKRGKYIELKHFLPLATGIVLAMAAYVVGLLFR